MATQTSVLPFRARARPSPRRRRDERVARGLRRAERVAWLMDDSIRIPILGYRIGLDAILGLVPGVGDALGLLFSFYPILEAIWLRAPRRVIGKMVRNVVLDFLAGLVPVIGDTLDAMLKVNRRNMELLRDAFAEPAPRRPWFGLLFG